MTTFDSTRYDIPTLIEKLRDQRFDGYDSESLAREVEKFRTGTGTASMGNAVEALKAVVNALANTDATLRKQLAELGVTWQSQGGGQASAVLTEQAGFASQAFENVNQAAQLIFEQGEAFNRTKNKLPDPETLRKGEGGYTFTDTLFSLFGFETDHAGAVKASNEARAQAIDALNAYAHDSGDYLASSQSVPEPHTLNSTPPPASNAPLPGTGAPQQTAPVPDLSPTTAASAKDAFPGPHNAPVPRPAPVHTPQPTAPPPSDVGIVATVPSSARPSGPETATNSTRTPGVQTGAQTPSIPVTRDPVLSDGGSFRSGWGGTSSGTGSVPPGLSGREAAGIVPGAPAGGSGNAAGRSGAGRSTAPGGPHGPGGPGGPAGSGGEWGKPGGGAGTGGGFPGGTPGGPDGGEKVLGKGKMVGAAPPGPTGTPQIAPGFEGTRPPSGVGGMANGATALGAAAVGGATSGEDERRGRGIGRSTAAERGKPVRPLNMGDLPEEEEAQRAHRASPQVPSRERTRAILEPAATQDGEEDAEHVRRYGIDDRDLFTDPREVAPDLIGDRPMPEEL